MARIAFIGLGTMGLPMAVNLVRAGHEVTGHNRSPGRTARFAELGGTAATDTGSAVRGAEVVITMLPDSPDVEAVADDILTGSAITGSARTDGALWIDMSTIAPATAREVADRARQAGGPWTPRSAAASRARSRAPCPSWSVARPRTSRPRVRCSTCSGRRSSTSGPAVRGRR